MAAKTFWTLHMEGRQREEFCLYFGKEEMTLLGENIPSSERSFCGRERWHITAILASKSVCLCLSLQITLKQSTGKGEACIKKKKFLVFPHRGIKWKKEFSSQSILGVVVQVRSSRSGGSVPSGQARWSPLSARSLVWWPWRTTAWGRWPPRRLRPRPGAPPRRRKGDLSRGGTSWWATVPDAAAYSGQWPFLKRFDENVHLVKYLASYF